jgi:hypothetical protein
MNHCRPARLAPERASPNDALGASPIAGTDTFARVDGPVIGAVSVGVLGSVSGVDLGWFTRERGGPTAASSSGPGEGEVLDMAEAGRVFELFVTGFQPVVGDPAVPFLEGDA